MEKQQFIEALQSRGIALSPKQIEQFEAYMHLLQEWNEKMNLTAITKEEEIWEKHFYDSIEPFIGLSFESMCDVGSGAGFPGIPVKIVYPDIKLTLVEPLQKRCRFLNEVKEQLGLQNVEVLNERAEDVAKAKRESFDLVSARAVARLSILSELCAPLVKVGGTFLALKGPSGDEELKNAQKGIETLGLSLKERTASTIDQASRLNFYFDKIKNTPKAYPRNYGQIKKKPLEESHG
jgi:16S rRNA (guanine527-N7)-methyltransferase